MNSIRRGAPYLLASICILASGFHFLEDLRSLKPATLAEDMVSPWDERMKKMREALPPDVFVIGYLEQSNIPESQATYDSAEFFLTQYGMAPVVVENGFGQEWIIGNFGNTIPPELIKPWLDEALGEYTIQDFGFGMYLIHDIEG